MNFQISKLVDFFASIKLFKFLFHILKFLVRKGTFTYVEDIKFQGWGMVSGSTPPWKLSENDNAERFKIADHKITKLVSSGSLILSQFKNKQRSLVALKQLKFRHYYVFLSAIIASNNSKSTKINCCECGVCDGLTALYTLNALKDKNINLYLYDSWQSMNQNLLNSNEVKIKNQNDYDYLNLVNTRNNLEEYKENIIFNKGYIPESFVFSNNPEFINWLHIDLNSAIATYETLNFFYMKLEINGLILFDDYGWPNEIETRKVIDNFFIGKRGIFMPLPTGQLIFIKQ